MNNLVSSTLPDLNAVTSALSFSSANRLGRVDASTETSIKVFRKWLKKEGGVLNASGVVSKACFDDWSTGRSSLSSKGLSRIFQRTLTSHITGTDARQPFKPDEEEAILKVIRKQQQWPAFYGTNLTIGSRGFRSHGYHEKRIGLIPLSTESRVHHQQVVVLHAVVQTVTKQSRGAAKRGASEVVLSDDKIFKRPELEHLPRLTPQQFWSHSPSTLSTANIYSQCSSEGVAILFQRQVALPPLFGMHDQLQLQLHARALSFLRCPQGTKQVPMIDFAPL